MDKNESLAENASKTTEIVTTASTKTPTKEILTGYNGLFILVSIGLVTAGFYFLYRKSQLRLDKANLPKLNIFKRLAQPKCNKCRFFDPNVYLKCAVHPVLVDKREAQNCPDYWQRERAKFLYR